MAIVPPKKHFESSLNLPTVIITFHQEDEDIHNLNQNKKYLV